MKIIILKERQAGEFRVAASPETISKLITLGGEVFVESGAGENAFISDALYKKAGAKVEKSPIDVLKDADIVLKVQPPVEKISEKVTELSCLKKGAILVGLLDPLSNKKSVEEFAKKQITSFAIELLPRITRAQSMDVLSSQSNLAGYKAVIDAVSELTKVIPMMTTAAGTIKPAKVLILGAGVAGLQAIATAKRLGAIVSVFDVRPAAKEQVESLGGKFIEVPTEENAETKGGYAKEMNDDYKKQQQQLIADTIASQDIVITTALIPGRPAPLLITKEMVQSMEAGSVIVDLATISGGNCELSQCDKVVTKYGVKIIGYSNTPSRVAKDASTLYAKNILNFVSQIIEDGKIKIDFDDEIIENTLLTHNGRIVHKLLQEKPVIKGEAKNRVEVAPPKKVVAQKKNLKQPAKPVKRKENNGK